MKKKHLILLLVCLIFISFSFPVFAAEPAASSLNIFSGMGEIARFLKRLIVPDANYFHNKLAALSGHVNERLGGVAYLYLMLNNFFTELKNVPAVSLTIKIPNNFFFSGYRGLSMDFLTSAKPYIALVRNVLTPAFCLLTAIMCYHKLRDFFAGDN